VTGAGSVVCAIATALQVKKPLAVKCWISSSADVQQGRAPVVADRVGVTVERCAFERRSRLNARTVARCSASTFERLVDERHVAVRCATCAGVPTIATSRNSNDEQQDCDSYIQYPSEIRYLIGDRNFHHPTYRYGKISRAEGTVLKNDERRGGGLTSSACLGSLELPVMSKHEQDPEEQLAVNPGCLSRRARLTHAQDEGTHLGVDLRSTRATPLRFLCPVPLESRAMPPDHSLRLDEEESFGPVRPDPGQPDPEETVTISQPRPTTLTFQDGELRRRTRFSRARFRRLFNAEATVAN